MSRSDVGKQNHNVNITQPVQLAFSFGIQVADYSLHEGYGFSLNKIKVNQLPQRYRPMLQVNIIEHRLTDLFTHVSHSTRITVHSVSDQ